MKFILNTAIDPHFCTLFDEQGVRKFHHEWLNRRGDGAELWEFLKPHDIFSFTFLGGIMGPGGFSSLRVGAGLLNTMAFTTGLPVHSLRADFLQKALLEEKKGVVLLNSFGDGVWIQDGSALVRKTAGDAALQFSTVPVCTSWLPLEKKTLFKNSFSVEMKNAPEVLLQLLQKTEGQKAFFPDYEVPAVI